MGNHLEHWGNSIKGGVQDLTDMVGLTDHEGKEKAQQAAEEQREFSNKLTTEEIEFQRQQYADWKGIYGDLQEDLGTYFKNLTGDAYAANQAVQQVTKIQAGAQEAQRRTDQALAQRGLTGGGMEAQALMQNTFGTEMQKANVLANVDQAAEQFVTNQKMGFLGVGLGQGTQMLGVQAGVSNTGANVAGSMSSTALGVSSQMSQANMKATSDLYGSILGMDNGEEGTLGSSLGSAAVAAFSDRRLKVNIKELETINGITFYSWDWNKIANDLGYAGHSFGVIAQEVQEIIPNSVDTHKGYLTVNYDIVLKYIKGTK